MTSLDDPDFSDGQAGKFVKAPAGKPPVRAWTLVFLANLPVPLFLGVWISNATVMTGKLGMACGVAILYWLGLRACHRAPRATFWVIFGGWFVAVSQFFPVLQIVAGIAGYYPVAVLFWWLGPFLIENLVVGFVVLLGATLGTGAILIAAAAALGSFVGLATD